MAFIATPVHHFPTQYSKKCIRIHSLTVKTNVRLSKRNRTQVQMFDPTPPSVTPDIPIVVGSVALALPFFIAAVLFGERIVRQRNCESCKGSGLVPSARGANYLKRCPDCGGFLPWQSWRRFFTG